MAGPFPASGLRKVFPVTIGGLRERASVPQKVMLLIGMHPVAWVGRLQVQSGTRLRTLSSQFLDQPTTSSAESRRLTNTELECIGGVANCWHRPETSQAVCRSGGSRLN